MSKIDLKSYLLRKRKTLQAFIVDQKIESYDQIIEYCNRRECLPVSKEEFEELLPKKDLQLEISNVEPTQTLSKVCSSVESTNEKSKNEKRPRRTKSNFLSNSSEDKENRPSDKEVDS